MKGHNGFVFTCTILANGDIASGGDDKTVKIWRDGACIQTINHPGTVWNVRSNKHGDLVSACEDYKIRTFTKISKFAANAQEVAEYEEELKTSE